MTSQPLIPVTNGLNWPYVIDTGEVARRRRKESQHPTPATRARSLINTLDMESGLDRLGGRRGRRAMDGDERTADPGRHADRDDLSPDRVRELARLGTSEHRRPGSRPGTGVATHRLAKTNRACGKWARTARLRLAAVGDSLRAPSGGAAAHRLRRAAATGRGLICWPARTDAAGAFYDRSRNHGGTLVRHGDVREQAEESGLRARRRMR